MTKDILVRNFNRRSRTIGEVFDEMEGRFGFLGSIRVEWYVRKFRALSGMDVRYFENEKLGLKYVCKFCNFASIELKFLGANDIFEI